MRTNRKEKILMFTEWYEPGFKAGGPIQACKNVVQSMKEEYEFFILCSDRDLGDHTPYENILVNQWIDHDGSAHIWYASPNFMKKKNLLNLMEEVKPDYIYFNSMYSQKYTLFPLWILFGSRFPGKIVLAPRGMLHKGALKKKYVKKVIFLKMFLLIGWSRKIRFQATDEQERRDLQYYFTDSVHATVVEDIPTVNVSSWKEKEKSSGHLRCIFLSRIHPHKNLQYFLNILMEIPVETKIVFDIYGSEDIPEYAEQCRKLAATLPQNITVQFKGALPFRNVFTTLSQYHLFVLPTLSENYGHAIFEALTTGLPVLISDQTPWRNLEYAQVGWDIPLSNKDKFKEAILQAAGWNQLQYNAWSKGAFDYAREYMRRLNAFAKYKSLFSGPERKSILLFTDWYEPGYKAGGPIQSCKNIVNILKGEYNFFIICSDRDLGDQEPYKGIKVNEWMKTSESTQIFYAAPKYITDKSIRKIISSVRPDFVYFNSMYSPLYTLLPLWILLRLHYSGKIILAPRGMLHKGALKRKYFKKYVFLKLFRFVAWHKRVVFHATNGQEQKDILLFFSTKANITVLDNIPNSSFRKWIPKQKEPDELRCVFISRIHPKKNLHYFIRLLGEIDEHVNLVFDVYGVEEDENYAADCKQLSSALGRNVRVSFKGPIPYTDVFRTLQQYHLFILPTLGENYGHVIYEALSAGDPVLISDQTPWRHLEKIRAGWDLPLNQKDRFIESILQAVAWNQAEYDQWSKNAFHLAENSVDIPRLHEKYKKLFG